eukprot:1443675-Rhodomonas_salina.2
MLLPEEAVDQVSYAICLRRRYSVCSTDGAVTYAAMTVRMVLYSMRCAKGAHGSTAYAVLTERMAYTVLTERLVLRHAQY